MEFMTKATSIVEKVEMQSFSQSYLSFLIMILVCQLSEGLYIDQGTRLCWVSCCRTSSNILHNVAFIEGSLNKSSFSPTYCSKGSSLLITGGNWTQILLRDLRLFLPNNVTSPKCCEKASMAAWHPAAHELNLFGEYQHTSTLSWVPTLIPFLYQLFCGGLDHPLLYDHLNSHFVASVWVVVSTIILTWHTVGDPKCEILHVL